MPGRGPQRSRRGCAYCRKRRIKCDEQLPSCGECSRTGRRCDSTSDLFRLHRSSFSSELPRSSSTSLTLSNTAARRRSSFVTSSQTNSRAEDNRSWITLPSLDVQSLVGVISPSSAATPPLPTWNTPQDGENGATPSLGHSTRPEAVHQNDTTGEGIIVEESLHSPGPAHAIFSTPEHASPPITINSPMHEQPRNPSVSCPPISIGKQSDEQGEVSFFLRQFSEVTGRWMDLFDLDLYYSRQVPVLARHSPLVKYAACALAAKQLGRVNGRKAVFGGLSHRLAKMETWSGSNTSTSPDYLWYGMKYYDKSISLLMETISADENGISGGTRRDDYNRRYDDETIVAATLLCVYEFLSATTTGWSQHLDGTSSLLMLTNQELLFQFQPSPRPFGNNSTPPKALRAAFWNFARQDSLACIISSKHTRLNTGDLDMWRAMGLSLDGEGLVSMLEADPPLRDDMIANTLVYLLCKIGNFIAAADSDDMNSSRTNEHLSPGVVSSNRLSNTWQILDLELARWHESLPNTFQPSATTKTSPSSPSFQLESWYSNSMCASTMQSYHLARMLLVLHRPPEESKPTSRPPGQQQDLLSMYKAMQAQLCTHAVEICTIALGRPDDSARIHMLQPLYYSGRCMTDQKDREVIKGLIVDIERDTGWATQYRVEQLDEEWRV